MQSGAASGGHEIAGARCAGSSLLRTTGSSLQIELLNSHVQRLDGVVTGTDSELETSGHDDGALVAVGCCRAGICCAGCAASLTSDGVLSRENLALARSLRATKVDFLRDLALAGNCLRRRPPHALRVTSGLSAPVSRRRAHSFRYRATARKRAPWNRARQQRCDTIRATADREIAAAVAAADAARAALACVSGIAWELRAVGDGLLVMID